MSYFGDINWLAILLAMVASMALGMAWYTILGRQWMTALGKSREDLMPDGKASSAPFIIAGICQLIMAYFLYVLTRAFANTGTADIQPADAILTGIHIWFGFILTSMVINHAYQGQKTSLTVLDGGYLLGVILLQGLVIGVIG